MASVFKKDDNFVKKQPRNTYDLSFQNNLTTNFGKLVPVLCQEVLPGDSFRIKPTFGLRFMPQVFPVQTRMRAHIHYFYVRNRTLWKDWMDFIGKTKPNLVPPYLKFTKNTRDQLKPSTLFDYMGLPVYMRGEKGLVYSSSPFGKENVYYDSISSVVEKLTSSQFKQVSLYATPTKVQSLSTLYRRRSPSNGRWIGSPLLYLYPKSIKLPFVVGETEFNKFKFSVRPKLVGTASPSGDSTCVILILKTNRGDIVGYPLVVNNTDSIEDYAINPTISYVLNDSYDVNPTLEPDGDGPLETSRIVEFIGFIADKAWNIQITSPFYLDDYDGVSLSEVSPTFIPYVSDMGGNERINALPFRAYEAIYNSFYRNAEVTPFLRNGQPEYNIYVTNDDGGADETEYTLFNRPWSDDRFTTSRVQPQAGDAPLVGLTGVQGATLTMAENDGTISTLRLQVDADTGNVMAVQNANESAASTLVDGINEVISAGITINDLRNVNSFTKWLENKNRRGFKYVDQLLGHYGVKARYDVLQMPEFIGGVSRDVVVNQISQTVENDQGNLGDIAGQAGVVGSGDDVSCFCDEHGFIIGIMSVVPSPMYSQTMPKHLLKSDPFDYFFPEFGKIGYQPIKNKEVSYLQAWLDDKQEDVFGYQRAWYDYLENLDSVHGLFKSDLKNFLLGRVFGKTPELSADFLYVKNTDLNNIFYVDDDNDKILGQIYHDIKAKRQIPLYGIPELE